MNVRAPIISLSSLVLFVAICCTVLNCLGVLTFDFNLQTFVLFFFGPALALVLAAAAATVLNGLCEWLDDDFAGFSFIEENSKHCVRILNACKTCVDCDQYNIALVRQGRPPVKKEVEALVDWALDVGNRLAAEKELEACQQACQALKAGASLHEA